MSIRSGVPPIDAIFIGAGNRGYLAYGAYASAHPGEVRFVAVAEPDESSTGTLFGGPRHTP